MPEVCSSLLSYFKNLRPNVNESIFCTNKRKNVEEKKFNARFFFFIKGPINIESHIYKATISKLERTFETRQEMTPKSRGG